MKLHVFFDHQPGYYNAEYRDADTGRHVGLVSYSIDAGQYNLVRPGRELTKVLSQDLAKSITTLWLMSLGYTSMTVVR